MTTKIKLQDVQIRFPDIFEPKQYEGKGDFYWSAGFLVPKGGSLAEEIDAAIEKEGKDKWGKSFDKTWRIVEGNNQKCSWQDGDLTKYDSEDDHMILMSKRKEKQGRPLVIDRQKNILIKDTGLIYSGAYVNASVEIWAQADPYAGIRCTLLGIQFNRDGDSFGGGAKPSEDDFDDLSTTEGADALV